ncbi:hypothetical protein QTP70_017217 [Hemibagrus guttatus]|uniref:Uncharacterized protein n=1 Tax=Hemibagrus guttatus TaxID=175788 RepID=A0AAE0Q2X2_9TELE|nr:hypothetical protein QTP70_017217 [Hemibagrus guttatus]
MAPYMSNLHNTKEKGFKMIKAGKMGKRKDLSEFDKGQIVMARRLDQSISKTAALVGCSRSAVEKYPDVVHLPEGCRSEIIVIQNPQLPGCTMSIFWSITVSTEGTVKSKIELLMKMPEQAQKLDTENVVASAPESFRSLLTTLGVEATIEGLIQSVCF